MYLSLWLLTLAADTQAAARTFTRCLGFSDDLIVVLFDGSQH
jgi:hypothetical protein